MHPFVQAAALNSQAIAAFLGGNNSRAIQILASSIQILKHELQQQAPNAGSEECFEAVERVGLETVAVPTMDSQEGNALYGRAIRILPPTEIACTRTFAKIYAAAVIFNLALVHHQQLLHGQTNHPHKATKLYSMVLALLCDESLCRASSAWLLIRLAAINNLAQIRYAEGNYQEAQKGLHELSASMGKANEALLSAPGVQGMLLNALYLRAPEVAAAA